MEQYLDLVKTVVNNGVIKHNRTGIDALSYFGHHYKHNLHNGFPMLTTKKISWKNVIVENLWFLSGEPHIGFLQKHGCKFWDPWADKLGYVPSAYGNFWRRFKTAGSLDNRGLRLHGINDQYTWMLDELRRNPNSRRLVITSWDPNNAQTSELPPCHVMHVYNVQEIDGEPRLCLHLTQRSADVALGVPYNLAGYSFLLQLVAHMIGMKPGYFSHTLVDAHIYIGHENADWKHEIYKADSPSDNHWPGLAEQLKREPRCLPILLIDKSIKSFDDISHIIKESSTDELLSLFKLEDYNPHNAIKFKVAV